MNKNMVKLTTEVIQMLDPPPQPYAGTGWKFDSLLLNRALTSCGLALCSGNYVQLRLARDELQRVVRPRV